MKFRKFIQMTLLLSVLLTGGAWLVPMSHNHLHGIALFTGHAEAAEQKYTCGMHPMIIVDEPGTCPICGMDLTPLKVGGSVEKPQGERKIKYWVAPMDPTYIRNEPGKSPMGMDLVPVYEDQAASGSIITIDPVTSQNMGVRTARVERRDLHRTLRTVGLVGYEEPKQYNVNSKVAGWVEKLYVNETGQQVRQGQALLEIYSPDLVTAQEEFLLARDNYRNLSDSRFPSISNGAKRLYEASRRRLELWDISKRQIERLEQSGKVRKTLTLYAPHKGIVNMKMVKEGEYVKPGQNLLMLSDISSVWVFADIYEYQLPWVKVGQEAEIILPYVGEETRKAKVGYIYPYVEPKTRTVKARLELENPDFELKPDMYVNVRLKSQSVDDVLAVPVEAVLHSGEKRLVFVALGGGKFEPRQVKTGLQDDAGYIWIKQGLFDKEIVVTSAQFMLDSESQLREAIAKMLEPKKTEPEAGMKHDHGKGESMEDLFGDDQPKKKENLEDLF